jgi:hypothetical protein
MEIICVMGMMIAMIIIVMMLIMKIKNITLRASLIRKAPGFFFYECHYLHFVSKHRQLEYGDYVCCGGGVCDDNNCNIDDYENTNNSTDLMCKEDSIVDIGYYRVVYNDGVFENEFTSLF